MKTYVLILAGGESRRMGGINKQFALVGGIPVIIKSVLAFENSPEVTDIVIAARECDMDRIQALCAGHGITKLRCIVPIPSLPLKDTVKFTDTEGFSDGTPDRASLRSVQTPQAFRAELYRDMILSGKEATDDAGLAELLGIKVKLSEGDPRNIKITTADDLPKEDCAMPRIGHGYDVHILAPDRKLVIGGVTIPYELGLLGHSDADVLVHAVMDAMLGALALGDIGKHFPDSDPAYKGADSIELLKKVNVLVREKGYRVSNLDCTINAEKPKLAPYIGQMRENIAAACGCDVSCVSVKATTEEGLGLAGKGIGAVCVCLLD